MGYFHLNLDALAEYTGKTVEELKSLPYDRLENMIKEMNEEKIIERNKRNAKDDEYERIVLKYFLPLQKLRKWFDDKEIVLACAYTGVTIKDLCNEIFMPEGRKCVYSNSEYLRTSLECVPKYDRYGRELAERVRERVDVYRVSNKYQGLCHGKVILHLLYKRYPELAKFGFNAYDASYEKDYEIYPTSGIYTSFAGLLSGDVDWILKRNRDYYAWYNRKPYTIKACEETFRTDEVKEMFDLITHIGQEERKLGHSPFYIDENGKWAHIGGLKETKTLESGDIKLLSRDEIEGKEIFKLYTMTECPVDRLVNEYVKESEATNVKVHICHLTDHLNAYGVTLNFKYHRNTKSYYTINDLDVLKGFDLSNQIVYDTFGYKKGSCVELTIRIDCLDIILVD